nr:uncharacterized protein LOC113737262 [Coffea arabica]
MTGDASQFIKLKQKTSGKVTFGDDNKVKTVGIGDVEFCDNNGIIHEFSIIRVPQQNGVVERKNRTLQEANRTMLSEYNLPKYFWVESINTACYTMNRVLLRPILNKTLYELLFDKKPVVDYFKVFGCKWFILNIKEHLGIREELKRLTISNQGTAPSENNSKEDGNQDSLAREDNDSDTEIPNDLPRAWKFVQNHPKELIIGDPSEKVRTRSFSRQLIDNFALVSHLEPKNVADALNDESWILAMEEELNQFERNKV